MNALQVFPNLIGVLGLSGIVARIAATSWSTYSCATKTRRRSRVIRFVLLIALRVPVAFGSCDFAVADRPLSLLDSPRNSSKTRLTSHGLSLLPVLSGDKDQLLQQALGRLAASPKPGGPDADADRHGRRGGCRPSPPPTRRFPRRPTIACGRRWRRAASSSSTRTRREAFAHVLAGRNVVTITPTASGKTLCYNAPVLDAILKDPSTRALYLFPTKALAQDQLAELHALAELVDAATAAPEIGVFTYDGDTPSDARRAIRGKAHVVLSNPDMLHSGILPHHPRWAKLFENLKFVIIDELHAYRGVFGSHLSNIMRRLQRVCRHYGSDPIFICSSATIANPRELAEGLTGASVRAGRAERRAARREVLPVRQSAGRQRAARHPALVPRRIAPRRARVPEAQPAADPLRAEPARDRDPDDLPEGRVPGPAGGGRRDPRLSRRLPAEPAPRDRARPARGRRCARSSRPTRSSSASTSARSTSSVMAGLSRHDCRDLAARRPRRPPLDAVGGGAGREQRADRSVHRPQPVVLLRRLARARADQSRQPAHPARPREVRRVRAAVQRPTSGSARENVQEILAVLAEEGFVHLADGQWNWTHESYPADAVSLRSVSSDNFVVVDTTRGERVIAETDFTSGPSMLHEKAIYIIEGQLFQVERLDFEGRKAFVRAVDCDYYTDAITYTKVTILDTFASRRDARGAMREERHGDVRDLAHAIRASPAIAQRSPRRSPRRLARRRLQEDQVLHERERRVGRAGSARAADAHHVVLADDSGGGDGGAAVRRRRSARRRRRAGVRDAQRGAAAADVRSATTSACRSTAVARADSADRRAVRRRARRARGRAEHLHLRQLSRRHRLQPAAVRACTRRCSSGRAS